ncbi:hypothetical protein P171DRAFT_426569 [Karstenula rhodostoma CBS 690.94]|uniref:Uncharacterized protein n=1 Tax=Karstenula rhodostoma CBS 690.94 TaxID=1392251 RepID=A0A9P4PXB0_9PLEO|nr:hypothetical protein P171DRAFT_426569 [Karstenula rhodostoma CBS 690.94]
MLLTSAVGAVTGGLAALGIRTIGWGLTSTSHGKARTNVEYWATDVDGDGLGNDGYLDRDPG